MITVIARLGQIYDGASERQLSYHHIGELVGPDYPVAKITGNLYILRSADGKLWEVRV